MVIALAGAQRLSIRSLAEKSGIHRNRLSEKIRGDRAFTERDILRLAEELGVSPGQLFDDPLKLLGATPVPEHASGLVSSTFCRSRRSERMRHTHPRHFRRGCGVVPAFC